MVFMFSPVIPNYVHVGLVSLSSIVCSVKTRGSSVLTR